MRLYAIKSLIVPTTKVFSGYTAFGLDYLSNKEKAYKDKLNITSLHILKTRGVTIYG